MHILSSSFNFYFIVYLPGGKDTTGLCTPKLEKNLAETEWRCADCSKWQMNAKNKCMDLQNKCMDLHVHNVCFNMKGRQVVSSWFVVKGSTVDLSINFDNNDTGNDYDDKLFTVLCYLSLYEKRSIKV